MFTATDVAGWLGGTWTDAQIIDMQSEIDALVEELEVTLNRVLFPRHLTAASALYAYPAAHLNVRGPIQGIMSVRDPSLNDVPFYLDNDRYGYMPDSVFVRATKPGMYSVEYIGGDPSLHTGHVVRMLKKIILRGKMVGEMVASGAVQSMSVEGTTLTYGDSLTSTRDMKQFVS